MPASSRTPLVLLLAASLSACAAGGATPAERAEKLPLASTASGNFLSGLAAQRGNDPGAAVEYYGAALKADPNDPQLLLRGLASALQDGRGDVLRRHALAEVDVGAALVHQ